MSENSLLRAIGRLSALIRSGGPGPIDEPVSIDTVVVPTRRMARTPAEIASAEALKSLTRLEREALGVYRRHGLPTRAGHYSQAPGQEIWRPVQRATSAEDRWKLLLKRPPEKGWRFAALADVGRKTYPQHPDVRLASDILEAAERWRARFRQDATSDAAPSASAFTDALGLVEMNAALTDMTATTAKSQRLRLLPVEGRPPREQRKRAPQPR